MAADGNDLLGFAIRVAIGTAASVYVVRKVVDYMDPTNTEKKQAKEIAEALLKRVGVKSQQITTLSKYELMIATHVVQTDISGVEWSDIGGLQKEIAEINDNVILPLKLRSSSPLFRPPHGVLLYGPPGCGKTLLARALAKAAGACFINLQVSTLTNMFYGETNKLAAAVFSLARKLQPAIIFVDEIDSLLRSRNATDHEATAQMKALFMSLWDGFSSDNSCRIIVLGATNRPNDVDPAILRRMPCRFFIRLPDATKRCSILNVLLKNEKLASDINLAELAVSTDGLSGSDLKEVARLAAINRAKELVLSACAIDAVEARPLNKQDFVRAIKKFQECKNLDSFLRRP